MSKSEADETDKELDDAFARLKARRIDIKLSRAELEQLPIEALRAHAILADPGVFNVMLFEGCVLATINNDLEFHLDRSGPVRLHTPFRLDFEKAAELGLVARAPYDAVFDKFSYPDGFTEPRFDMNYGVDEETRAEIRKIVTEVDYAESLGMRGAVPVAVVKPLSLPRMADLLDQGLSRDRVEMVAHGVLTFEDKKIIKLRGAIDASGEPIGGPDLIYPGSFIAFGEVTIPDARLVVDISRTDFLAIARELEDLRNTVAALDENYRRALIDASIAFDTGVRDALRTSKDTLGAVDVDDAAAKAFRLAQRTLSTLKRPATEVLATADALLRDGYVQREVAAYLNESGWSCERSNVRYRLEKLRAVTSVVYPESDNQATSTDPSETEPPSSDPRP